MAEDRPTGGNGAGADLSARVRACVTRVRDRHADRLPRRLRHRLETRAATWIRDECPVASATSADRPVDHRAPALQRAGWYAAAACLVLALAGWWPRLESRLPDYALAVTTAEVGRWPWAQESGLQAHVEGEVVWDGARQRGHLTLAGLQPTARAGGQYQLWIFDAARDDRYPVDGGVFDVPEGHGPVTVPIRPAVRVHRPQAFAITLEPVGGVVVSDRRHLMAMARATPR